MSGTATCTQLLAQLAVLANFIPIGTLPVSCSAFDTAAATTALNNARTAFDAAFAACEYFLSNLIFQFCGIHFKYMYHHFYRYTVESGGSLPRAVCETLINSLATLVGALLPKIPV